MRGDSESYVGAAPVTSITSDRITVIEIQLYDSQVLSIVGVYLPSSDHPLQEFADCLIELESAVSALQAEAPVMLAGDFNASLCGRYSRDSPNQAG